MHLAVRRIVPSSHLRFLKDVIRTPKYRSYSKKNTQPLSSRECAFAFDIDGVLLKDRAPIPGAREALRHLQKHRIPFILMTNGGGKHESDRAKDLSRMLGVEIKESMLLQSHTPFKTLVDKYEDVLVIGGEEVGEREAVSHGGVKEVAERYGFHNVYTPHSILHHHPEIWPFDSPKLHLPHRERDKEVLLPKKIDAVLVFNDPRHWGPTIQIMLDIMLSDKGALHTVTKFPQQPDLWWSNPDLIWQSTYSHPRLAQGAFRAAFEGVWTTVTGGHRGKLKSRTTGKPHKYTYDHGFDMLQKLHKAEGYDEELKQIYMVGDNPDSDVQGANRYGWQAFLVKTGVYRPRGSVITLTGDRRPYAIVDDVGVAVDAALRKYSIHRRKPEGIWIADEVQVD